MKNFLDKTNTLPQTLSTIIPCSYAENCGGCHKPFWALSYFEQLEHKKNDLKNKLNNANIHLDDTVALNVLSAGAQKLRTRFDFTFHLQSAQQSPLELQLQPQLESQIEPLLQWGLYGGDKQLVDLQSCLQLHPSLEGAFQKLRSVTSAKSCLSALTSLNIRKGSARLRLSPDHELGLWLDLANIDIKHLLEEKSILLELSKTFFIELGQKKKTLDLSTVAASPTASATTRATSQQLKLSDPLPRPWFQSLGHPLYCAVSSFTQPSWVTADLLTEQILQALKIHTSTHPGPGLILEYGCGIGQYTTALLRHGYSVNVFESDAFALHCLSLNTQDLLQANSKITLEINKLPDNAQTLSQSLAALVNPPRSGLRQFTQTLLQQKPQTIIYVSCAPESLVSDLQVLGSDYKIYGLTLIDQFPMTSHYEVCALLQRI